MPKIAKTTYIEAIGRRKTARARVRIYGGVDKTAIVVNEKEISKYFPTATLVSVVHNALIISEDKTPFSISAHVIGGGSRAQAEAIRHGIARALIVYDPELRGKLKKAGYLKRDPRVKERRKFGLKKARKAPQWSKR